MKLLNSRILLAVLLVVAVLLILRAGCPPKHPDLSGIPTPKPPPSVSIPMPNIAPQPPGPNKPPARK